MPLVSCLISKFEPGLSLGGYGLDYITDNNYSSFKTHMETRKQSQIHNQNHKTHVH